MYDVNFARALLTLEQLQAEYTPGNPADMGDALRTHLLERLDYIHECLSRSRDLTVFTPDRIR